MGSGDDGEPRGRRGGEIVGWLVCLAGAVLPTALLAQIAERFDKHLFAGFTPALYLGLFTVLVLVVRPWTLR